jgi:UMF1 family MFS transporter
MAILFARKEINMSNRQISIALVIGPIAALCGGYFWLWVSRRFNWTTQKVLLVLLGLACALPVYGLLGYIPGTPEYQVIAGEGPNNTGAITIGFGMKSVMEMYIAVFYFAALVGSMSSFGRVLYTDLLPKGHEAEFFALSEICLRGTSWIGPLVVGAIANASNGNLRPGFAYILLMLSIPIVLLSRYVDVPKGRRECQIFLAEEAAKRAQREERRRQKQLRKLLKKQKEVEDGAEQADNAIDQATMEMKAM